MATAAGLTVVQKKIRGYDTKGHCEGSWLVAV